MINPQNRLGILTVGLLVAVLAVGIGLISFLAKLRRPSVMSEEAMVAWVLREYGKVNYSLFHAITDIEDNDYPWIDIYNIDYAPQDNFVFVIMHPDSSGAGELSTEDVFDSTMAIMNLMYLWDHALEANANSYVMVVVDSMYFMTMTLECPAKYYRDSQELTDICDAVSYPLMTYDLSSRILWPGSKGWE